MKNYKSTFYTFLENLEEEDNKLILDVIKKGFCYIAEALSTDDANAKKLGVADYPTGMGATVTDVAPNMNNDYFERTLPPELLKKVLKSQMGRRVWKFAEPGRQDIVMDPLKSGQGYQNAVGGNNAYAGSSGGYNLGGPLNVSGNY